MENDVVIPSKPIFYCRYVDDIYNRRKKNIEDSLFKALNSCHKKIGFHRYLRDTKETVSK